MKKSKFEKKLASYSALTAGALALASNASGQIIYNDITPDAIQGDTSIYELDLNLDSEIDITIYQAWGANYDTSLNAVILGKELHCEILGSSYMSHLMYPFALNINDPINASQADWQLFDFGSMNFKASYGTYGNWVGVSDKYLGVKLVYDTATYYSWVRLDVRADARKIVIKDYAFDSRNGHGILAGNDQNGMATKNMQVDVTGSNNNAGDLQLSFNKADNETGIVEYRVMIVSQEDVPGFTVAEALNVSQSNYLKVDKTSSDHNFMLTAGMTDVFGNTLALGTFYRVFVLSVADGSIQTESLLSTSNKSYFIFNISADKVSNIQATDINDYGNGADLQVSFDKADDESTLSEYWLYVVKSTSADNFDLMTAYETQASLVVNKTGSDISIALSSSTTDTDDDLVENDVPYKVFVVSMADGVNATLHSLSDPSNEIILTDNTNGLEEQTSSEYQIGMSNGLLSVHGLRSGNKLFVYDLLGNQLLNMDCKGAIEYFDMTGYPKAYYVVKVQDGVKIKTYKVILD